MNRRILDFLRRPDARFFTTNSESGGSGSNVEAELISESIMWFDAAKGVTLSGSYLDIWEDQSSRGMVAQRSNGAITNNSMEYFITGGVGGQPMVRANADGEYGVTGSMFESTGSWFTLYVVYNDTDEVVNTIRYHFDVYNTVSSRRRIAVQKNSKRPGVWTSTFQVSSPGSAFSTTDRYTNTGSMCFTYLMQGDITTGGYDFTQPSLVMYRDRGLFSRQVNNQIAHPECWVNVGGSAATFSLLGAWNEATGQRAQGEYSLICAFSGSHNATERARVWDYIEGRFGVAQTLTPDYAFTSGTMPYQYTDVSLIPSASINPDFFNKAFTINFTLQDWTQQNNFFFHNPVDGTRFAIESSGQTRLIPSFGSALTAGSVSGSSIGDQMRLLIDWERGNLLLENITKNMVVGQQHWSTPLSMSYADIQWLYYSSTNPGLGSGSWNVYAPDLNIGY